LNIENIEKMQQKWTTNKLDLVNKNGDYLCRAFGCRKHTKLMFKFGDWFCPKHINELIIIRSKITHDGNDFIARLEEIRFRKIICPEHAAYAHTLEI
jgi:hypothetical protein